MKQITSWKLFFQPIFSMRAMTIYVLGIRVNKNYKSFFQINVLDFFNQVKSCLAGVKLKVLVIKKTDHEECQSSKIMILYVLNLGPLKIS